MNVEIAANPHVAGDAIAFSFGGDSTVTGVALAHELRRPRRVEFERDGRGEWSLHFPLPAADRIEYLLELTHGSGGTELVPDPRNPLRAPGPFGDKSVVELPGYAPPAWLEDDDAPAGELRELLLPSRRLHAEFPATLWSPVDTDPDEPLPLLLVHDGPEYADYSALLRLLDHLTSFGELPPFRAGLLQPVDRNEIYSASTRYARALVEELLPALRDTVATHADRRFVAGMGASLGALAMLHSHWTNPGAFGGLYLQSGSYFRQRYDRQESGFPRFRRISRFVGQVLGGRGRPDGIPVTITCGTVEENLENNRAVARALVGSGYDVRAVEHRDAHNWISWRDTLDPHLTDLLLRAWT